MNPFGKEYRARNKAKADARVAKIAAWGADRPPRPPAERHLERFTRLGVQIMADGSLHTFNGFGGLGRPIGAATGAHAEVGAERSRHRVGGAAISSMVIGPAGLLGAVGKKAKASSFVILADGTLHERSHDGNIAVTDAQKEAIRFNAAVTRLGSA
jgi:hypothetical protein